MMTTKQLMYQLQNLVDLLMTSELAVDANQIVQDRRANFRRVTWAGSPAPLGGFSAHSFATVGEYFAFLESRVYTAVLYDGALLQISYDFDSRNLIGHRLCYYPCPYDIDEELLRSDPLADVICLYRESPGRMPVLRSPCRFDYDELNAEGEHPSVHLHLIRDSCRFPVARPVGIGHFVKFVFRHFYPNQWAVHEFLRTWPEGTPAQRTITTEEESQLHITYGLSSR